MSTALKSRRLKVIINVVTVLALVALAYALRDQLSNTISNFAKVNIAVLLLMIPLQGLNYFAQARLYQELFRLLGDRFRTRPMARLALELNFINNVFPSGGVSGFSYITLRLRDERVSAPKATLVQMMKFILVFVSFQILLLAGLLILAIGGQAGDVVILIAGSLATLLVVGTLMVAFVIGSKARINAFFTFLTKLINGIIHVFRRDRPETISIKIAETAFTELHENYMQLRRNLSTLRRPLWFALLANGAEVLTIYVVYVAFGEWVNMGAVIIAYAVANFAGLVSILPGGVGIYEALMTAVLAAGGIPAALSLPVTVMYRVLNMLIQLPPGYFFYHRTLHAEPAMEHFEHE